MRLTVERRDFAAVLTRAAKSAAARVTIPVLAAVLLRAHDDTVEVATTDLDRFFTATIKARVDAAGAIAVNAALLASVVRGAANDLVELELDGLMLAVRSGPVRARLPTVPAEDFPEPFGARDADFSFNIDAAELTACLDAVGYAVCDEKTRYYLSGAAWSVVDGRLEWCATDGRALSLINIEAPPGVTAFSPLIVPDFELPPFEGLVRVELADSFIRFSGDAGQPMSITSKLIDGTYPDYRRFIQQPTATATVKRAALVAAVGRCLPLCQPDRFRTPVDLIHDRPGELIVRVRASEGAEIEDQVAVDGALFVVSLGGFLLANTLASFDGETIDIGLTEIGGNVRLSDPDKPHRLAIIMPMLSAASPHRIGPPTAQAAA